LGQEEGTERKAGKSSASVMLLMVLSSKYLQWTEEWMINIDEIYIDVMKYSTFMIL
jgi:hypothetical protein